MKKFGAFLYLQFLYIFSVIALFFISISIIGIKKLAFDHYIFALFSIVFIPLAGIKIYVELRKRSHRETDPILLILLFEGIFLTWLWWGIFQ